MVYEFLYLVILGQYEIPNSTSKYLRNEIQRAIVFLLFYSYCGRRGSRTPKAFTPDNFQDCLTLQCSFFLGGGAGIRTQRAFTPQISNLLQYHYVTLPCCFLFFTFSFIILCNLKTLLPETFIFGLFFFARISAFFSVFSSSNSSVSLFMSKRQELNPQHFVWKTNALPLSYSCLFKFNSFFS